jgi:hypothetical protein
MIAAYGTLPKVGNAPLAACEVAADRLRATNPRTRVSAFRDVRYARHFVRSNDR